MARLRAGLSRNAGDIPGADEPEPFAERMFQLFQNHLTLERIPHYCDYAMHG